MKQLEHYPGLNSWLRMFIPNYAVLSAPLHERKVVLYKNDKKIPLTKSMRMKQAIRTTISDITQEEIVSFRSPIIP
jgi:hypothetical protein